MFAQRAGAQTLVGRQIGGRLHGQDRVLGIRLAQEARPGIRRPLPPREGGLDRGIDSSRNLLAVYRHPAVDLGGNGIAAQTAPATAVQGSDDRFLDRGGTKCSQHGGQHVTAARRPRVQQDTIHGGRCSQVVQDSRSPAAQFRHHHRGPAVVHRVVSRHPPCTQLGDHRDLPPRLGGQQKAWADDRR